MSYLYLETCRFDKGTFSEFNLFTNIRDKGPGLWQTIQSEYFPTTTSLSRILNKVATDKVAPDKVALEKVASGQSNL